jgi:hypothetical protein
MYAVGLFGTLGAFFWTIEPCWVPRCRGGAKTMSRIRSRRFVYDGLPVSSLGLLVHFGGLLGKCRCVHRCVCFVFLLLGTTLTRFLIL